MEEDALLAEDAADYVDESNRSPTRRNGTSDFHHKVGPNSRSTTRISASYMPCRREIERCGLVCLATKQSGNAIASVLARDASRQPLRESESFEDSELWLKIHLSSLCAKLHL